MIPQGSPEDGLGNPQGKRRGTVSFGQEMNVPATQKPTPEERVDRFKRKTVVSVVGAVAIVLLGILTYGNKFMEQWDKIWARLHPKTYDVAIYVARQTGLSPITGLPMFWRVDDTGDREQPYCPIGYFLTLSITNLLADPMTIIGYEAAVKDPEGEWLKLPRIAMSEYQHLYATTGGLSESTQFLTDPPPLDQQLSPTSILPPHKPLVGIAFFEDPTNGGPGGQEFRITIRDALGHVFTSGTIHPEDLKTDLANFGTGMTAQLSVHADLSDMKKHSYRQHCHP
jgi:hypothetical protein